MTQVVQINNEQIFEQSPVLIGSEAKNPLPINSKKYCKELTLEALNPMS
ncbi:MAG: hypothetical protein ACE5RO_04315 [Candidatus Nitrosomaritimum yanchengensis]